MPWHVSRVMPSTTTGSVRHPLSHTVGNHRPCCRRSPDPARHTHAARILAALVAQLCLLLSPTDATGQSSAPQERNSPTGPTPALASPPAQAATAPGTYELFGSGCNGARIDKLVAFNEGTTTDFGVRLSNEYAFAVLNPTQVTQSIQGFALVTRSATSQPVTVTCGLYRDAAVPGSAHTAPAAAATQVTTMEVAPSYNWYRCFFPEPMVVAPGEAFWITFDHTPIDEPDANPGTQSTTPVMWRNNPFNGTTTDWANSNFIFNPIFRLYGLDGDGVAVMTTADVPQSGGQMTFTVRGPTTAQVGWLITGTSDTGFAGVPLPLPLAPFRMRGCTLYTYQAIPLQTFVMFSGSGSVVAQVPSDPNLIGLTVFNQVGMLVPGVNPNSLLFTNAGRGVIGP